MRKLTLQQQKKRILKALGESDNITQACTSAGITRDAYRTLLADGVITSQDIADCKAHYADKVLAAMHELALNPLPVPVYDYGKPRLDSQGQPVTQRIPDIKALTYLAERLATSQEQAREARLQEEVTNPWFVTIDTRELKQDEIDALKAIAQRIENSKKRHDYYERSKQNNHDASQEAALQT